MKMLTTASPFPAEHLGLVYEWACEYPDANIDDYAPKTRDECILALAYRFGVRDEDGTAIGGENDNPERSWAFYADDQIPQYAYDGTQPCGMVGYLPLTPRLGTLHGVLFASGKSSREGRRAAIRSVIEELFAGGVEKITASFFATNTKIGPFLQDLGFKREGYLVAHTLQHGEPMDLIQVALLKRFYVRGG